MAQELAAAGRIPHLARHLPGGRWEKRHAPGSFTYASHQAIFAGFLPTPASPGPHPRLFAARFGGSETTADRTPSSTTPRTWSSGLAAAGYRTVCIGGVGFFNQRGALGSVLPGMFQESHWEPEFGVTVTDLVRGTRSAARSGSSRSAGRTAAVPLRQRLRAASAQLVPSARRHPGDRRHAERRTPPRSTYVDRHIGRLFAAASSRRRCFTIVCSDHGTAYGDDGCSGHRLGHEVVWTVPYAHFFLDRATR